MQNEQVDQEVVWSAIRYLDPDERDREAKCVTIIAISALLLAIFGVWVELRLRVQGP